MTIGAFGLPVTHGADPFCAKSGVTMVFEPVCPVVVVGENNGVRVLMALAANRIARPG